MRRYLMKIKSYVSSLLMDTSSGIMYRSCQLSENYLAWISLIRPRLSMN